MDATDTMPGSDQMNPDAKRISLPRALVFILGASFVAKLWVVWATHDILLILDEEDYLARALFLLDNGYLEDSYRPPLYILLVAVFGWFGDAVGTPVRLFQVLLSTLASIGLYVWLRPMTGHRGALFSAALFALYPTLIGFTHLLWTETVFLSLLIGFFWVGMPNREVSLLRTTAAGAIYGFAVLTRSMLLPFFPVAILFVVLMPLRWSWRSKPLIRAAVFAAAVTFVIAPWSLHNRVIEGHWVLVETNNGYNLWKGNTPKEHPMAVTGPKIPGPLYSVPMFPFEDSAPWLRAVCARELRIRTTELSGHQLDTCGRRLAVSYILSDLPAFGRRGLWKLAVAFHPSSILVRHMLLGYYGSLPPLAHDVIVYGTAAALLAMLVISTLGAIRVPKLPVALCLSALALYQLAVIFIAFGNSRFRLPVLLVGMIFAAWIPRRPAPRTDE